MTLGGVRPTQKMPQVFIELTKFSTIGVLAFVVDAGVLTMLLRLGFGLLVGRLCSFLFAASVSWYANRNFTFAARQNPARVGEWSLFIAANSVGAVLNYSTYAFLVISYQTIAQRPVLGVAAGSVAGLASNFLASRYIVFRAARPRVHPEKTLHD